MIYHLRYDLKDIEYFNNIIIIIYNIYLHIKQITFNSNKLNIIMTSLDKKIVMVLKHLGYLKK